MDQKSEKHRGSYRTHRRSVARRKNMEELKQLRELLKWGPPQVVPPPPDALVTGYPDPQQVPLSTADLVDRATRDLKERNRQLKSHILQLQLEAKEQAEKRKKDKKIKELLFKEIMRLNKKLKEAGKASTRGSN